MAGYIEVKTPVIGIPKWKWKNPMTLAAKSHGRVISIPNKDLCFECSRHIELLSLFDQNASDFQSCEYYQYQIVAGKKPQGVIAKIEGFRQLYIDFKRDGAFKKPPLVTDDGCRLDGSHRLAILSHLNVIEASVMVMKYEWLYSEERSKEIRQQVEKYRREKYGL